MRFCLILILSVMLFTGTVFAADVTGDLGESLGTDELEEALPGQARDALGDLTLQDALQPEGVLKRLWNALREEFFAVLRSGLRPTVCITVTALLCALSSVLFENGAVPDYVPLAGTLVIAAATVGELNSFLSLGVETLSTLSDYSKILLPCLTAAAAASGAVTSAAAKYAATALFMDVMLSLARAVVLPAICAYAAVVIANAAIGGTGLAAAVKMLKTLCRTLLTAVVLCFTAYLSLTGVISGSADAVALRVAKTAISSALPVVGSIVSDAAGAVLGGAAVLRGAVGIFGMLAVLGICLTPFLQLGVRYLLYKLAAMLSAAFADSRLSGLISGLGDAFGMITAMVGAGGFILFVSMISGIKAVSGA